MKLTSAAVLAFIAASALATSVPSEDTAVYSHDFYERDSGEGSLESFDKRGGAIASSLPKSFAGADGSMGGRVASNSAQYGLSRDISSSSYSTTKHPPTRHQRLHLRQLRRQRPPQPSPQPPFFKERTVRRGLSTPVAHLESLEKRGRGKAKSPSPFKAAPGGIGTMDGRVAGSPMQLDLLKTIIPPTPPPLLPMARRALFPDANSLRAIKNAFSRTSQATARVYRKSAPKGKDILIAFIDGVTEGIAKKKDKKKKS